MSVDYRTLPAFCRVAATTAPTADSAIKFEVWLPARPVEGKGSKRHSASLMISTAFPLAHPPTTGFR